MADWYKSGIEAFCKVAVTKVKLPSDISGWGVIVAELLGEESPRRDKKDKMSKLWRLSPRLRVKEFEDNWAQTTFCGLPDSPLQTCVDSIMTTPYHNLTRDYFAGVFKNDLLAMAEALAQGFITEGYPESTVRFFLAGVRAKLKDWERSSEFARSIMYMYIAAIIYGPAHPAALSESNLDTVAASCPEGRADTQEELCLDFGERIMFTQLHGEGFVYAGDRESIGNDTVLFFGLNSSLPEYQDRLAAILKKNGIKLPVETNYRAFSIPRDCSQVSRYHAAVFHLDDRGCNYGWYCVDLGSKNGTAVVNARGSRGAEVPISIEPGSRILLGGEADDCRNAVVVASIPFRES